MTNQLSRLMLNKTEAQKLTVEAAFSQLQSSSDGLSELEAKKRLTINGANILKNESRKTLISLILNQFKSSLVYLLVLASLLSFLLHDPSDSFIILVILVVNTGLGFYQEYRSESAVAKLQKLVSREALVRRDGQEMLVPEHSLVPGDVVILREGDIGPADVRLVKVSNLSVNESQLTGESVPVVKAVSGESILVFAGSIIERGEAEGLIYATGQQTELGRVAHLSSTTQRTTQYEKSLAAFSAFLIKTTLLTLAVVFIIKLVLTHDAGHVASLGLFIVALAITVVPEAMPVIATVTLSAGAIKLAKRHVIARTLTAVEDFGNITLLCSDKTGTLTENRQTVKYVTANDESLFQKLALASLERLDEKRKKFQTAFDRALLAYIPEVIQHEAKSDQRIQELPFDPAARRRRVVSTIGDQIYLIEVGSAETLIALTDDPKKTDYLKIIKEEGQSGLRHLGIAYKLLTGKIDDDFDILKHEHGLQLAGFVSLEDPLRATTKGTIGLAQKLNVAIKILSGDSKEVTEYVAREVGLITGEQTVYTGDELEKLSDDELGQVLQKNHAFARLNPELKYRIIKLLKRDNVVGYQGDGINDAPALKLADVAIAVSHATDVAQDSADILLLRNDLSVIIEGIRDGRAIFSNINKYLRFTMVSNFGNFFAISILYLVSGLSLPLLPIQLVLTSLLTDVPCITIATDNVDEAELVRPSQFSVRSLMLVSIFLGLLTAGFEVIYYAFSKSQPAGIAQTGLYLFLTLTALITIVSIRSKNRFWQAPKLSIAMATSFATITVLAIAMVYVGVTKNLFTFTALPLSILVVTGVVTVVYVFVLDTIKVWFYRSNKGI